MNSTEGLVERGVADMDRAISVAAARNAGAARIARGVGLGYDEELDGYCIISSPSEEQESGLDLESATTITETVRHIPIMNAFRSMSSWVAAASPWALALLGCERDGYGNLKYVISYANGLRPGLFAEKDSTMQRGAVSRPELAGGESAVGFHPQGLLPNTYGFASPLYMQSNLFSSLPHAPPFTNAHMVPIGWPGGAFNGYPSLPLAGPVRADQADVVHDGSPFNLMSAATTPSTTIKATKPSLSNSPLHEELVKFVLDLKHTFDLTIVTMQRLKTTISMFKREWADLLDGELALALQAAAEEDARREEQAVPSTHEVSEHENNDSIAIRASRSEPLLTGDVTIPKKKERISDNGGFPATTAGTGLELSVVDNLNSRGRFTKGLLGW